jgi:very-short-patch-repair endonuclease/DNA polymerase III delta prime subunit
MALNEAKKLIARERIARLFRFMGGMQQLSSPPSFNLKSYGWKLRWADIPSSKYVQVGRLGQGEDDPGDDFLLRVRKPNEKKDPATALFDHLLDLNNTIERESEKVELVLGDGVIKVEGSDPIDHPLLLQKLQVEFLAESAEIVIREADHEAELYLPLLRRLSQGEEPITRARKLLQDHAVHPLGKENTNQFFSALWQQLWAQGNAPATRRDPVLYLGFRSATFTQAIETFLQSLPELEELPPSLVRVVGVDPGLPANTTPLDDSDLLLTMPSNPEQERVLKRLHSTGAVLVQGPPGTGKTHTIANLIGHLLAQGKSILVTSQASKALRIVRDMVIPELRPLCVSVLEQESESRDQLEAAVKGIVNRFTSSDPDELDALATQYEQRRKELRTKLAHVEEKLLQARLDEYRPVTVGGESIPPARAAQLLVDQNAARHNWLPGPVTSGVDLPLTTEEIRQLYRLNRDVPAELEADLDQVLPPIEELISDFQFRELVAKKKALQSEDSFGEEFWDHDTQDSRQLQRLLDQIERAVTSIQDETLWILDCMRVGMLGGAHKQTWEDLVVAIETAVQESAELERQVLATGVALGDTDMSLDEQLRTVDEIITHLRTKGSISMWTFISTPWKKLMAAVRVNGKNPIRNVEEAEGVRAALRLRAGQQSLRTRWDRQMSTRGAPSYDNLGEPAHDVAYSYLPQMKAALGWYDTEWDLARRLMKEQGLRWSSIVDRVPIDTGLFGELYRIREAARRYLIPTIQSRKAELDAAVYNQRLQAQERLLTQSQPRDLGGILSRLRQATNSLDPEAYARAWAWFMQLHSLKEPVANRNALLVKIREVAPEWAQAIRDHRQPHDRSEPPGDPVPAWKFRQWTQQLDERCETDPEQLQHEAILLKNQLRLATAHYVEHKTWANQLRRTGVRQQQALVGWLDLMRKIGSGKGKRAPKLKATAREKLAECRDAVPVWIMPLARVAESYHPGETRFDVVILDEASQCDVTGLLAFALGKEVLVVGDNEQVSPEAVGMSYEKVESLIEEHLYDIPNKELYDGKTSVYDLARQSFGGTIRLVEHFRCVPEIIAFSNKLCYQGEIQPLRETSQVKLRPPTRFHKVEGGSYQRKVNKAEAEEVASLIVACSEQPEYAGQTMGMISLVGEEQALLVDKLLTQHMPLPEYQGRRILCGNAAQFQGDERDVMFLSLVETADDSSALSMRRTEVFIKRFNVAASRARNQLWVVGGLDPDAHLKQGDLREMLIRHALEPQRTMSELAEKNPRDTRDSRDLDAVGGSNARKMSQTLQKELEGAGYRVHRDFPVGNYLLDLVVEGKNNRLAIRCDGDRDQAPDRFKVVVEREAVLERLGWRFVSLRATQYYREPEQTVNKLLQRLRELGLEPAVGGLGSPARDDGSALYRRVTDRAAQLQRLWASGQEAAAAAMHIPKPLDVSQFTPPAGGGGSLGGGDLNIPSIPDLPEPSLADRLSQRIASFTSEPAKPAPPQDPGKPPAPSVVEETRRVMPPLPSMPAASDPFPPLPGLPASDPFAPLPPVPPSLEGLGSLPPVPPLGGGAPGNVSPLPPIPPSFNLNLGAMPPGLGPVPEPPKSPSGGGGWKDLLNATQGETQPSFIPLQIPDPPKRPEDKQ